jgi:hypothetical protein
MCIKQLIKTYGWIVLIVLSLALVGAAWAAPDQSPTITRHVIAGGGARLAEGSYTLRNTIGQPVVGISSNVNAELCAGFWCRSVEFNVFLPLTLRG